MSYNIVMNILESNGTYSEIFPKTLANLINGVIGVRKGNSYYNSYVGTGTTNFSYEFNINPVCDNPLFIGTIEGYVTSKQGWVMYLMLHGASFALFIKNDSSNGYNFTDWQVLYRKSLSFSTNSEKTKFVFRGYDDREQNILFNTNGVNYSIGGSQFSVFDRSLLDT